uniref:(northern house mosquito) hypothetical protein n=1 Tax=Culex pipiens TaxID=7175 RepID=A0A8D8KSH4_CULPI
MTTPTTTTADNSVIGAHKSLAAAATGTTSTRFKGSRVSNSSKTSNSSTSTSDKGRVVTDDNDVTRGLAEGATTTTETISEFNFLLQDYTPAGMRVTRAVGMTTAAGPEPDKPRITVSRIRRVEAAAAADVEMCFKFNEIIL